MFIVRFRAHGQFELNAKCFGPFNDHVDAYDFLCALPAVGTFDPEVHGDNVGYKFITELLAPEAAEYSDDAFATDAATYRTAAPEVRAALDAKWGARSAYFTEQAETDAAVFAFGAAACGLAAEVAGVEADTMAQAEALVAEAFAGCSTTREALVHLGALHRGTGTEGLVHLALAAFAAPTIDAMEALFDVSQCMLRNVALRLAFDILVNRLISAHPAY